MGWFITGIVLAIIGAIAAISLGFATEKRFGVLCGIIAAVLVVFCMGLGCMANVPTGHTGVLTTFGKVENHTLDAGMNFKAPWQEVSMKYTVNYQISSADAMTIYKTIGIDYYNNIIVPNITEAVKTAVAHYNAEALVSGRSELSQVIQEDLTVRLANYNIIVVSASIEDMDFTDAFTNAVEAKQVAEQNKLKAQTEAEQRIIEANAAAEIAKVNAEATAEAKKIAADAEAYEIAAKAQAEAAANKQIAESLTKELIEYKYYETWNGELPDVVGADTIIKMPE